MKISFDGRSYRSSIYSHLVVTKQLTQQKLNKILSASLTQLQL